MDGLDGLTRETSAAQADEIDSGIADGLLARNYVRRDVLARAGAALEHHVAAHADELVEQTGGRDDCAVFDLDLAGELRGVADDAAVADYAVVSHVHVLHQQVAVTHHGLALRGCAARDGDILTDGVVVADLTGGILALELQILRFGRDAGTREELVAVADAGTVVDRHAVEQLVVIAYHDVLVDDAERSDDIVVAQFCLWIDHC